MRYWEPTFDGVPQSIHEKLHFGYLTGCILLFDLSFTFARSGWARRNPVDARRALIKTFQRSAKKVKVKFRLITTGITESRPAGNRQVHFHIICIVDEEDRNKVHALQKSILSRWEVIGNGGAAPDPHRPIVEGYACSWTPESYAARKWFDREGYKKGVWDRLLFKARYNLNQTKQDMLFAMYEDLSLERIFSPAKRHFQK